VATHPDCITCRANRGEVPTPGGVIYQDALWRLEHTFEPIPLVGWLVLKPLRHIENVAELNSEEAAGLGPLIQRVSAALTAELGCPKVYVCVFAEAANAAHVHVHLIARPKELPAERRGPGIFDYMRDAMRSKQSQADVGKAERLAERIRARLTA
jgi:diadenosine tetraphosphate (Ap4A) HIT family hydrolase